MANEKIRIGLIGAGANTRSRHIPGLQAIENVEIVSVCNRRETSTQAVAKEYGIPRACSHWQEIIDDPEVDAIVIGTWPYLHCPITLAALEAGKHVLTEARMSMNATEAQQMLSASQKHPELICQIVPSPFGLTGHQVMKDLIANGYLGDLRELHVYDLHGNLADEEAPLAWRQDGSLSGYNMLTLGILHETLLRWTPPPVRVLAQVHAHIPTRIDPVSGARRPVGTPDSAQVLTVLESGARGIYQFSGVTPFGQARGIRLYGSQGALHYDLLNDRIYGASHQAGSTELQEIPIPEDRAMGWRVEEEFIEAIRNGTPIELTDFATGALYMEFTEAVAQSAEQGEVVELPLFESEEQSASS